MNQSTNFLKLKTLYIIYQLLFTLCLTYFHYFRTSNIVSILGCPLLFDNDSDGIGPTDGVVSHGGQWLDCNQTRSLHAV